jgi:hypothetical protein
MWIKSNTASIRFAGILFSIFLIGSGEVGVIRVQAQGTTATILGTVTDMSGAAIPETAVQVKNVGTGITQSTVSDAQGRFTAPDLGIGDYEVQASRTGFSTVVRKGITLTVGSQAVVDFSLPVGQQTQTVTVESQASQVETTSAAVGSLITQAQMANLPLNGRNFEQLIFLSPGVQVINSMNSNARQGRQSVFSAAGARPEGQELLLDDESIVNFWKRGVGTITGSSLGMEAMAEFQALTNTYGAQFGGNGAVINAVSKSGTNSFHGSAYEFIRNSAMDAKGLFDPYVIPFRRNQPGGSLGGPVKRDKAFFFVNYEGVWQLLAQTKIATVPDATHRTPTFARATNPVGYDGITNALALYPLPTYNFSSAAGTGQVNQVASQIAHENYFLGRFDYTLSTKDSLFTRYFFDKQHVTDPFGGGYAPTGFQVGLPLWGEVDDSMNHFATIEWRRIISPTLLNTARVSFSRPNTAELPTDFHPALQVFPGLGRSDAAVRIGGLSPLGQAIFVPATQLQNRYTEADDLVWTHGAQTMRFGASIVRQQSNDLAPVRSNTEWIYGSLAVFRAGGNSTSTVRGTPGGSQYYFNRDFREIDFRPYFQDDWKVTPKLTLNLGLRWEFTTNPVETHNALYQITDYLNGTGVVNVPHVNQSNPSWWNLEPRFGFAYDVFAHHRTAIRGGFAITHSPIFPAQYVPHYFQNKPSDSVTQSGATFPVPFSVPGATKPGIQPGWDWFIHSTPYLIQYNLNIQHQISDGTVFTVGYVGSHGVHLITLQDRNPPTYTLENGVYHFATLSSSGKILINPRVNPNLDFMAMSEPTTTSRYDSLQTSLSRRLTRNVQGQVAYTFSKCIDDGGSPIGTVNGGDTPTGYENPYDRSTDRGLCYYHAKSSLRVNGLVSLPFHRNQLVEGWQLTGTVIQNTGLPISVSTGFDQVGYTANSGTPRPNYAPNNSAVTVNGRNYPACNNNPFLGTADMWLNPNCYSLQAPGTLGNAGRNTLIGPGLMDVDFAVLKDTRVPKISEAFRIQFRAEFFNLFNHPQLGQPNISLFTQGAAGACTITGLGCGSLSPTSGQITSLGGNTAARQIQFGLKFLF